MNPYPSPLLRVLKLGFLVYPVLVWALWNWSPLGFWGSAFLALLVELLPILGLAQLPLANDEDEIPLVPVYLSSAAMILALGWGAVVIGVRELGREAMGLDPGTLGSTLAWGAGLMAAIHLL